MKKTRFEKFMSATVKAALKDESLDTFEEHLKFVRLSIEMKLISSNGTEKTASEKSEPKKRRSDQVVSVLGSIKRGLMWTGSAIRRAGVFLGEGNNALYSIMGAVFAYVIIIMLLGMY